MAIHTKNGILVADKITRVVHGRRGDYAEFEVIRTRGVKKIENNTREKNGFYDEYRTSDDIKVYYQFEYVNYADYKPGLWYISVDDLQEKFPLPQGKLDDYT